MLVEKAVENQTCHGTTLLRYCIITLPRYLCEPFPAAPRPAHEERSIGIFCLEQVKLGHNNST